LKFFPYKNVSKINIFFLVSSIDEEDLTHPLEEVEAWKRIGRSKDFAVGSITCEAGFVYTAILSNACILVSSLIKKIQKLNVACYNTVISIDLACNLVNVYWLS